MFESLDDADVRTAGTTYLMYRGRHRHERDQRDRAHADRLDGLPAAASAARASSSTPTCSRRAGPAAARSSGCPGSATSTPAASARYLVEHDLFDFLLLSLPDNDTHSHKHGPDAQVTSLAAADRQIERLMHAAGGPDAFLEDHAVIVCSDHSQSQVEDEIDLFRAFDGFARAAAERRARDEDGTRRSPLCPSSRAAQVYVLDRDARAALDPAGRARRCWRTTASTS